jgi:hypothetical protein
MMFFGLIPDTRPNVATPLGSNTVLKNATTEEIESSIDELLSLAGKPLSRRSATPSRNA